MTDDTQDPTTEAPSPNLLSQPVPVPEAIAPSPYRAASDFARDLIAEEVAKQDAMWGVANERADSTHRQLHRAALAQLYALDVKQRGDDSPSHSMFDTFYNPHYPKDWSGLRDYGSDIANLVVAAAFIQQEIKRKLMLGESTERTPRKADQPYASGTEPYPAE